MSTARTPLRSLLRASQLLRSRHPWNCTSRNHGWATTPRRGVATTPQRSNKPYYVTTPIFYVNAGENYSEDHVQTHLLITYLHLAPHVGHLYTMVIADIMKRWQVLLGNTDAQLLTGTDEHGMKVVHTDSIAGRERALTSDHRFNKLRSKRAWIPRHFAI
jgi:methionyl-tRNA synthetase